MQAQEFTPGSACGFTQPNVQFWGNCSTNAGPSCATDSSQGTQWGWYGGTDETARKLKTSPSNPIWMQVQCFVQLSFGPGCAHPTYIEVKDVNTGNVIATQFKYDCTALVFQVPNAGTYRATCYNNSTKTCTASYDTFTVLPRAVPCTSVPPAAAILTTPANNSSIQYTQGGTNIPFAFNLGTGWGTGCPSNSNSWDLQIQRNNCTGNWLSFGAVTTVPSNYFTTPGEATCWRVNKSNGSSSTMSSVFRFTLVDDRSYYDITSRGLQADVCGGGFSGVASSVTSGITNPLHYDFVFNTYPTSGNNFKEIWLAMVPDGTDNYNRNCPALGAVNGEISNSVCQNMETLDIVSEAVILQKAKAANTFVFRFKYDNNPSKKTIEALAYNGVGWNSTTTTGQNLSGLGATLLDFNGVNNSTGISTPGRATGNFWLRFDTIPQGKYKYYGAAIITNTLGEVRGSYASPGVPMAFKKLNVSSTLPLTNWGVDLVPPAAAGTFGTPKFIDGNTFSVDWSFKELNSLRVKTFITSEESGSQLQDLTAGANIAFPVTIPDINQYNVNNQIRFNSISNANGIVTESSLGTRQYFDSDTSLQSNYQLYAYTADAACNQKVITASATVQNPWLITYNGGVSATGGYVGLALPNGLGQLSAPLNSSVASILADLNSVSLSTYGAISGNSDIPLRKVSRMRQYATSYDDLTVKPPLDGGFTKWYDYVYDLVLKNQVAPVMTVATSTTLSGTTSSFVGASLGTKKHVVIEGNLIVDRGTVCDTQTIFFVKGTTASALDPLYTNSTIKITPDFTVSGNDNGCLFVTKGDILVDNGSKASLSTGVDSSTLSNYDLIEAALMTDGKLITLKDVPSATEKGDGLAIKGSVVAEDLTLQRDININANQFQPAHLFYFDPRYREIFKSDLDYNKYSLREVGYSN